MTAFLAHLAVNLRLYFRNRMALVYGYLFPVVFLVAFWVLYRYERVPLVRHMGELLTVAALGGACFGLPTTMVSERERGVWRRYRVTPVRAATLVSSTVAARYLLLLTAGALQLALAMAVGMPLPAHPLQLVVAFTFVSFGFLGLGLVVAMLADNVPAVQALGQCIFLPMLIIGGVAVPLTSLPDWALHVSAFFPGRYAVQSIQACVAAPGLRGAGFSLIALAVIGLAGVGAAAGMFRWDAQQRFSSLTGKPWIAVALGAWIAVGVAAEWNGTVVTSQSAGVSSAGAEPAGSAAPAPGQAPTASAPASEAGERGDAGTTAASRIARPRLSAAESAAAPRPPRGAAAANPPAASAPTVAAQPSFPPVPAAGPKSWREATIDDIDRDLLFDHLPPDSGIISPVARRNEAPDPEIAAALDRLRRALSSWPPGTVADPVQKTRNYLVIAAVPDLTQRPLERFAPLVIFDRLQQEIPREDLIKILYWIAMHPDEGDDSAVEELPPLGVDTRDLPADTGEIHERVALYAVKLLGRLLGRI